MTLKSTVIYVLVGNYLQCVSILINFIISNKVVK
jgi:hypothetical protein